MIKKYSLTKSQFLEIVQDSNIILPDNSIFKNIKSYQNLFVPEFLQFYPNATDNFLQAYINTLYDYSKYLKNKHQEDILKNNIAEIKTLDIINFEKFCNNHNNYAFSVFLDEIGKYNVESKKFFTTLVFDDENLFHYNKKNNLLIDILKLTLDKQPLETFEKDGVLQFKALPNLVISKYLQQDFNIQSQFAYPEYQIADVTYDDIFDIKYSFPLNSPYSATDNNVLLAFQELIKDDSPYILDFFKNNQETLSLSLFQTTILKSISDNSSINRIDKTYIVSEILKTNNFSIPINDELTKLQNWDNIISKDVIKKMNFPTSSQSDDYPTFKFITYLSSLFNTSFITLYNLESTDLNKAKNFYDLHDFFVKTLKNLVDSKEFLEVTEIICKNNTNKIIVDLFKNENIYILYPFLNPQIKSNLSLNITEQFLNIRKKNQRDELSESYNKGSYACQLQNLSIKPHLANLNIFEIVPFYDALKNNTLKYENIFDIFDLPSLDIDFVYQQPQIKLLLNHMVDEIKNLNSNQDIKNSPIIKAFDYQLTPISLIQLLDKFITDELNNPISKIQDYSNEDKIKISYLKKENWNNYQNIFPKNISFSKYYLQKSFRTAISNVLIENPNFYSGQASQLSSFDLQYYTGIVPLSQLLSSDFREIIENGKIQKYILSTLLMSKPDIFPLLPENIKNSNEAFEITRDESFFQQTTGGNCTPNFLLTEIYNKDDSDFLLERLYSKDCEHAPDFTNTNSELLNLLPQDVLDSEEFWVTIIKKEYAFFGREFFQDSTVFNVIPKKILEGNKLFNILISDFPIIFIESLPIDFFRNTQNSLKFLESVLINKNIKKIDNFLESKIPKIYHLYNKISESQPSLNSYQIIEHIIIMANENILQNTISIPQESKKSRTIKF